MTQYRAGFEELENPWPALSDLLAATTLIFLVLFAVIAVPALKAKGRLASIESTLDTLNNSISKQKFNVRRVGDYLLVTIKGDAVFPQKSYALTELKVEGREQLRLLATYLKRKDIFSKIDQIQVVGHTSREGSDTTNWRLSSQRAATVAMFLIQESNLPACAVTALGRGHYYPLDPDRARRDTTADPADRRIEIEIRPRVLGDSAQAMRRSQCVDSSAAR